MARTLRFSRLAAPLVAIVPFAAMFAAACGGSDTIPEDVADATPFDGTVPDTGKDVTVKDSKNDTADARDAGDAADVTVDVVDGGVDTGLDVQVDTGLDVGIDVGVDAGLDAADASDAPVEAGDASTANFLGSSSAFTVFSGATVTNATATLTTITGDLGTYPSTTAIGPTPPVMVGVQHLGDTVAQIAAGDIQNAYNQLIPGNLPCGTVLTGLDLGGRTLVPGVYCFSSSAGLTGTLTLDAQNNPNARWVFQVGSALTTATGSQVVVINGTPGQVCNAFWQVSSSATLGTTSVFGGTVLAQAAVTVTTGTTVTGRLFGLTAQVSLDTNTVSNASCSPSGPPLDDGGAPIDAAVGDADAGLLDAADGGG